MLIQCALNNDPLAGKDYDFGGYRVTISNSTPEGDGYHIEATLNIAGFDAINLAGYYNPDTGVYLLTGSQDLTVGDFTLQSAEIRLGNEEGLYISGALDIPYGPTAAFTGSIAADGSSFSFTFSGDVSFHIASQTIDIANCSFRLDNDGLYADGWLRKTNYPEISVDGYITHSSINLSGSISTSKSLDIGVASLSVTGRISASIGTGGLSLEASATVEYSILGESGSIEITSGLEITDEYINIHVTLPIVGDQEILIKW